MSLFFRSREARALTGVPFNMSDGVRTHTLGSEQGMSSALRLAPVFAAVSLITNSIKTCPLRGYRNAADGTGAEMPVQPPLLTDPGVFGLSLVPWLSQMMTSLLLRGNAYGIIAGTSGPWPTKIQWLYPDSVQVDERHAQPIYRVNGHEVDPHGIVHIQGMTVPGSIVGMSPLTLFRTQIETGRRIDKYKWDWYDNTSIPRGILQKTTRALDPREADEVKDRFKAAVNGHDILVTGSDWRWDALGVTAADAQFLEGSRAGATEIAAIFHVPPEEIGGAIAQPLTYKTLEANTIQFTQKAVLPWAVTVESALTLLLPKPQYAKFKLDHLIRTEMTARMSAYQVGLSTGVITQDEARQLEDKAPLTAAQVDVWQKYFGKKSAPAPVIPPDPTSDPADMTAMEGKTA